MTGQGGFVQRGVGVLVFLAALSACSSSDNGGNGGVGKTDGSIGSSCGTCQSGLECVTQAPGGYCSKTCASAADCGSGAYCYQITGSAPLCLRGCQGNADCRDGYTCQGDPGGTVCYPDAGGSGGSGATGGSGGGGGDIQGNSSLQGCYWRNQDLTFRLYFDGQGSFQDVYYNPAMGSSTSSGSYQVQNAQLFLSYSDGTSKTYALAIQNGQVVVVDGGAVYAWAEAQCS